MESLRRIAKAMDKIAAIVSVIWFVSSCLMLAAAAIISVGDGSFNSYVIKLGSVELEVLSAYGPSSEFMEKRLVAGILMVAVLGFFVVYAVRIVRKILSPMKEGLPFDDAVYKNLKKMGILILIGGAVYESARLFIDYMVFKVYDIPGLLLNEKISECRLDLDFDPGFIIIGAVVFMLSYIFRYGTELQRQSDETL
ncbi:MAG: hypothetical protein ACI4DV_02895 [Lachnospiraceae bacterium]